MPRIELTAAGGPNLAAFLDMIAWSEGTPQVPGSDDGYNIIVGGTPFDSYADHPRKMVHLNEHLSSTAAGRYQLLARYFDSYRSQLKLNDFSPLAQDMIAIQQIKECRALELVKVGYLDDAIRCCARIWASLPGAGYGQRENDLAKLREQYVKAGGTIKEGVSA